MCTLASKLLSGKIIVADGLVLDSQGRQEDAEEYLGFTLNGLHEEMLALKKLISPQEESKFFSFFSAHAVVGGKVFFVLKKQLIELLSGCSQLLEGKDESHE